MLTTVADLAARLASAPPEVIGPGRSAELVARVEHLPATEGERADALLAVVSSETALGGTWLARFLGLGTSATYAAIKRGRATLGEHGRNRDGSVREPYAIPNPRTPR